MLKITKRRRGWLWKAVLAVLLLGAAAAGGYAYYYYTPAHYADRVTVLEYHDVSDASGAYTITPALFRKQLDKLRSAGANFIRYDQFEAYLRGEPVPGNAVLVTFDDGYASYTENALPILREYGIPSVNFLITGSLQGDKTGVFLNEEQVRETIRREADDGNVAFGCHTHASHRMENGKGVIATAIKVDGREESADQYHERVRADLAACEAELQSLYESAGKQPPQAVHALAYPFGSYDPASLSVYRDAGIRVAFTGELRLARRDDNALAVPRINAGTPSATPNRLQYWIKRGVNRAPAKM